MNEKERYDNKGRRLNNMEYQDKYTGNYFFVYRNKQGRITREWSNYLEKKDIPPGVNTISLREKELLIKEKNFDELAKYKKKYTKHPVYDKTKTTHLSKSELATLLEVSTYTIDHWYNIKKHNPNDKYFSKFPTPNKVGKNYYWTVKQLAELAQLRKDIPKGYMTNFKEKIKND